MRGKRKPRARWASRPVRHCRLLGAYVRLHRRGSRRRRSVRALGAKSTRGGRQSARSSPALLTARRSAGKPPSERGRRPSIVQVDACGRGRSPATLSSFHQGRPPRNNGQRYPADPPTVEEIIAVMRSAGEDNDAVRVRGLIVVLWRAGLRISEALALTESDMDVHRGAILVRRGNGGKRREVGMDRWGWEQLRPWLPLRGTLSVGALVCVLRGPTRRPGVGARRCPISAAPCRRPGGGATSLCPPSAQTRPCRGDVARGGAVARHPAPTWARRSRDHLGLRARDRQHRDRPGRPRASSTDDPGHPRPLAPGPLNLVGRPHTTHQLSMFRFSDVAEARLDQAECRQLDRALRRVGTGEGIARSATAGTLAGRRQQVFVVSRPADLADLDRPRGSPRS